jgi:hypothetical protein
VKHHFEEWYQKTLEYNWPRTDAFAKAAVAHGKAGPETCQGHLFVFLITINLLLVPI